MSNPPTPPPPDHDPPKFLGPPFTALGEHLEEILQMNKDPALVEKLTWCLNLSKGLDDYIETRSAQPGALEQCILDDTRNHPWTQLRDEGVVSYRPHPGMMTDSFEGAFLRLLAQLTKAERVLDIGMFTGHSAVCFGAAKYVKEVVCLEMEPYFEKFLQTRLKGTELENRVRVILGPALESLQTLKNEKGNTPFDLIFIDADKSNYINYFKFIMDHEMLSPNGFFLIDNVLWGGSVLPGLDDNRSTTAALKHFNDFVSKDPRVEQVILPIRDGVSVIARKL